MNIQPPSSHPREISVTEALEPALERVKQMLFKPFNLAKWFTIGFCAWLAGLGESGGGFHGGFNDNSHHFNGHSGQPAEQFRHFYYQASDYVLLNLAWLVPVVAMALIFVIALWLLLLWLNCRGKFMFLHCIALDKAEVEVPWKKFARPANSLLRFRIALGIAAFVVTLPMLILIAACVIRMVLRGEPDFAGVMSAIGLTLGFLVLALAFGLIRRFLMDFVVPIMFLRGGSCLAAWGEFFALFTTHFWNFVLYLLFRIVLNLAISILILLAVLATCCILGCLMLLPFFGTVLLLPVLIFKRAYPLYYLAQFGPRYDVFPPPAVPPLPGGI